MRTICAIKKDKDNAHANIRLTSGTNELKFASAAGIPTRIGDTFALMCREAKRHRRARMEKVRRRDFPSLIQCLLAPSQRRSKETRLQRPIQPVVGCGRVSRRMGENLMGLQIVL